MTFLNPRRAASIRANPKPNANVLAWRLSHTPNHECSPPLVMNAAHPTVRLEPFKVACSSCNLRELCLPVGMSNEQLDRLDAMVETLMEAPRVVFAIKSVRVTKMGSW